MNERIRCSKFMQKVEKQLLLLICYKVISFPVSLGLKYDAFLLTDALGKQR